MDFNKLFEYTFNLNLKNQSAKDYYDSIISFDNSHFIPAVRFDTAIFLNMISKIHRPKKILEIGFGSGASALFINRDITPDLFISLDLDKNRINRGKVLLENLNVANVSLVNINVFDFFKTNNETFDFIFLDSVKREYIELIEPITRFLNKNGLLLVDNTYFNGKVVEEMLEEREIKRVGALKKFNEVMSINKDYDSCFLNIGDGLLLSIKK
jgi:predicted O-methyltransferase YrrM